jgi:hypothetical protein
VTFPQRMEHRTTKKILSLVFSFIFALFSLPFFKREEEDGKAMTDCVRGHKGAQGKLFVFIAPWCHSRGDEATNPSKMQ